MVKIVENPMSKWMIWGGKSTTIFGNIHILKNIMMYFIAMVFRFFTFVHLSNQKNKESRYINISLHGIASDVTFVGIFDTW